jgi:hypothetical protein
MDYQVNKNILHYDVSGEKQQGENIVLLDRAIDLTAETSWKHTGYTIEKLFDDVLYSQFQKAAHQLLIDCWRSASLIAPEIFQLDQYHKIAHTQENHLAAVEQTKTLDVKLFPVAINILEQRISAICRQQLIARNPYDNQSIFHFRVIRPKQQDNNPLHRDVWLEDYKDCINLYIPIAGSNENSSLVIVPGSHQWPESKIERTISGAHINNIKYNVPAITSINAPAEYLRPNPKENEVLVFSPYLIHGGAANLNDDRTRISIEIRLWRK